MIIDKFFCRAEIGDKIRYCLSITVLISQFKKQCNTLYLLIITVRPGPGTRKFYCKCTVNPYIWIYCSFPPAKGNLLSAQGSQLSCFQVKEICFQQRERGHVLESSHSSLENTQLRFLIIWGIAGICFDFTANLGMRDAGPQLYFREFFQALRWFYYYSRCVKDAASCVLKIYKGLRWFEYYSQFGELSIVLGSISWKAIDDKGRYIKEIYRKSLQIAQLSLWSLGHNYIQ